MAFKILYTTTSLCIVLLGKVYIPSKHGFYHAKLFERQLNVGVSLILPQK